MPKLISWVDWKAFCLAEAKLKAKEDPYDEGFNFSDEQSELEKAWEVADSETHNK